MKSIESIYNSILLENQNPNNIDIELLMKCVDGTYTINEDGSIDIDGDVSIDIDGDVFINNNDLIKIPFKFRNVIGYFDCSNTQLTSLEGAPNNVSLNFYCNNNQFTSLEGAPSSVGGSFYCHNNQLISLKGAPNSVGGSFNCGTNQIISLDGAPNSVGGYFSCFNNPNLPYSELFKIVDNVKGDIYYSSDITPEDKDKIRRDRDVKGVLKDDELGNLDV